MGSHEDLRKAERLERLFAIFLEEARMRPELADRLIEALQGGDDDFERDLDAEQPGEREASAFSLVAILHGEGEERLRECLSIIPSREHLLVLADEQHIPLPAGIGEKPLAEIVEAVVEGVKFRLNDRLAAAS